MINAGLATGLTTGSYYGSGYNNYSSYGNRTASGANIKRISRDLSQGYGQNIDIMYDYFQEGNTNEALKMYKELFDEAQQTAEGYGYELTDSQIRSTINTAFQNRTGSTLTSEASNSGRSSFVTGLLEGIPLAGWLFADPNSSADARATIDGKEAPSFSEKAKEVLGASVTSAVAMLGLSTLANVTCTPLAITGISALAKGSAAILSFCTGGLGILPLVGAALAVGGAVVGIKHLVSKAK